MFSRDELGMYKNNNILTDVLQRTAPLGSRAERQRRINKTAGSTRA